MDINSCIRIVRSVGIEVKVFFEITRCLIMSDQPPLIYNVY